MDFVSEIKSDNEVDNRLLKKNLEFKSKKHEKHILKLKSQIPEVETIFNVHYKIGQGTFSSVFLASLQCQKKVDKRRFFAIKHLVPTNHPNRVERELKCMQQIGGVDNVVGIDLCLRKHESIAFVMPYVPHDKFNDFFEFLTPKETQNYIKNLLIALKRVHSFNIIHRDVKPSNFLHDRKTNKYLLVDFGLAQTISRKILEENGAVKRRLPEDKNITINSSHNNNNSNINNKITPVAKRMRYSSSVPQNDNHNNNTTNNENLPQKSTSTTTPAIITTPTITNNNISNNAETQFKTPLKQSNEIITTTNNIKRSLIPKFPSPLETNLKSAILGMNLNMLMQRKQQRAAQTNHTSNKYNTDNHRKKNPGQCYCYGKGMVCNICVVKMEIQASRAGTPGYRPPEVLLKHTEQDTSVDIWAAGVIFISILSKCYPFFKANDDFTALAEIITVFGDEKIKKTALSMNRHINISCKKRPLDLRKLCVRLRNRFKKTDKTTNNNNNDVDNNVTNNNNNNSCNNCQQIIGDCLCEEDTKNNTNFTMDEYSNNAYDLLKKLLEINPKYRITASDALQHPYFKEIL